MFDAIFLRVLDDVEIKVEEAGAAASASRNESGALYFSK